MKVKDKFPLGQNGLFYLIDSHRPFAWNEFFTPVQMDNYFYFTQAESRINFNFEEVNNETIANLLAEMYVEKWNKIYTLLYANDVNLGGYKEIIHEEIEGDTSVTETENNSDLEKYSAFDSNTLENKTGNTETNSRQNVGDNSQIRDRTRTGHNTNYVNNINTLMGIFTNKFLYDIIITDVKKIIVCPIY